MCRESREDKECLLTKSRKDKKDRKRIVVAATGASGLPILKMCLQIIRGDSDYESILILSDSAKITLQQETKDTVEEIEALAKALPLLYKEVIPFQVPPYAGFSGSDRRHLRVRSMHMFLPAC